MRTWHGFPSSDMRALSNNFHVKQPVSLKEREGKLRLRPNKIMSPSELWCRRVDFVVLCLTDAMGPDCVQNWASSRTFVNPPDEKWVSNGILNSGGAMLTRENRRTRGEICPITALPATKTTWTDLGANPCYRGKGLSLSTARKLRPIKK